MPKKTMLKKIKRKLSSEYRIFRKETTWFEYALWWLVRAAIVYALFETARAGRLDVLGLRLVSKLSVSFVVPLLHLLPRRVFFARLSYRVQTFAAIMIFLSSFLGQYKNFYGTVEWFDDGLHAFGCFVCVFAGYELLLAMKRDTYPLSPLMGSFCGFGFSFFFAVGWEIFEFTSDIFIGGNAQNWMVVNSDGLLRLLPDLDPRQHPLLDTMMDLVFGSVGSLLGGVALYLYIAYKNKAAARESAPRKEV